MTAQQTARQSEADRIRGERTPEPRRQRLAVPSPTCGHQDIGNLLWVWPRANAPSGLRAATAAGVLAALDHTFEPDMRVFAYGLGADATYRPVAESTEELVLERPFPIRLPISEITP
jgi:hypothetical protein